LAIFIIISETKNAVMMCGPEKGRWVE